MSLCPSSSHQLVAAAIAFRRARRKFPKDFGLESIVHPERIAENTKTQETATSREGSINQARSSFTLVRRVCNSRSDHVCPASVQNRDYDHFYGKENTISCSCCRMRNIGEGISKLRDECNGGDAIDMVPSRECEEFVPSSADCKNNFAKPADRDRCDVSRSTDDGEAIKTIERIPQSVHPISYHRCKTRCPCLNVDPVNNLPCDSSPHKRHDKIACGDFTGNRGKECTSTSCHGTSIDLGGAEEDVVTNDARVCGPDVKDAWTRANTLTAHRKIVDSTWRCECHPREDSIPNLSRSSSDRSHDGCYHHCDYFHRHCCYQQRDSSCINVKGCETRGNDVSGEKAQHKSWRDQMRGENSRLYARQCCSKEYSGIIPASRERNGEECRKKNDDNDAGEDEDDDSGVAVINHKDSICILAEKYKTGKKWRDRRCVDKERSGDKDECNKSLTSEIVDQSESPFEIVSAVSHEGSNVKHVCRAARCENCGAAAIARTCGRGCGRHAPPEGEFDRLKSPLNETAATRCCSSRVPCRRVF